MRPAEIFWDIADAIRERGNLPPTTLIPVKEKPPTLGFAGRINAFVAGTGANPDARRMFHFTNFLTPAEETSMGLLRCDGRPVYQSAHSAFHAFLRTGIPAGSAGWQSGLVTRAGQATIASRIYDTFLLVGTKLYVGSSTSLNHILVVNTSTGAIDTIQMPAARVFSRFDLIGTWIYCLHPASSITSHNSIYAINTANDSVHTINLPASRGWYGFAKVGNKWFIASRGTATTDLIYLNVTSHPGTVTTIAGATSTSRTQHLIIGGTSNNKIYIAGASASDYLAVVDGVTDAKLGEIHGLTNRTHNATYSAGRWLYLASSSAVDHIIRIDTDTNSHWTSGGSPTGDIAVPSRTYSMSLATNTNAFTGKLIGTKLYVGANTGATTLVVINNTNGAVRELEGLPNRTWTLVDDDPASFVNWNANWVFESCGQIFHKMVHLSGTKLYLTTSSGNFNTLVFINTTTAFPTGTNPLTDSVTEIASMTSRAYNRFFVNGTILYALASTTGTTIEMINLSNDTRLTASTTPAQISNLFSRAYGIPVTTGAGATARLYLGGQGTNIPIINLSNNTLVEDARGLLNNAHHILMIFSGKIYAGRSGTQPAMLVLSDAVLPTHPQPVYIRPD